MEPVITFRSLLYEHGELDRNLVGKLRLPTSCRPDEFWLCLSHRGEQTTRS